MARILFKKIGMTNMFNDKFQIIPITVLQLEKTFCVEQKNLEKHGYESMILSSGEKKNPNKALAGKNKITDNKLGKIYESKWINDKEAQFFSDKKEITVEDFVGLCEGKKIKATANTKGKGFSGTVKRWNFRGLRASHGVGTCERAGGSTGQRTEPGRTFPNKKMAGHYGNEQVTITNLTIHGMNKDFSVVFIKGAIPGPNKGSVFLSTMKQRVKKGGI